MYASRTTPTIGIHFPVAGQPAQPVVHVAAIGSILRDALYPARAPRSRRQKPETLRALNERILRDLGMSRSESDKASTQTAMLRAFYGL
jgi:uncharacterized protein YjiS (DUF1127 family)